MIRLFKNSEPLNALWLLVFAYLIRLPALISNAPALVGSYREPISGLILDFMKPALSNSILNISITCLIVVIQALWLNYLVYKYNLLSKNSYLPALFYVIVASVFPSFQYLNSAILVNFFSILLLDRLISLYKNPQPLKLVFDIGMLIGLSTMVYFPTTVWLLMIWVGLIQFRPFVFREWIVGFLGFLVPYVFVALFYFLANNMAGFIGIWEPLTNSFPNALALFTWNDLLPLIPLGLALLFSFFKLRANFWRSIIQVRKSLQLILVLLFLSAIAFYTKPSFGLNHFVILSVPLSIFCSYFFLSTKRTVLAELLFWIILGTLLFSQII